MNFQTNDGQNVALNRLLNSSETPAQSVNRLTDSGRPRSARTEENVDLLSNGLVLSQEDTLQTHRMVHEILIIG